MRYFTVDQGEMKRSPKTTLIFKGKIFPLSNVLSLSSLLSVIFVLYSTGLIVVVSLLFILKLGSLFSFASSFTSSIK